MIWYYIVLVIQSDFATFFWILLLISVIEYQMNIDLIVRLAHIKWLAIILSYIIVDYFHYNIIDYASYSNTILACSYNTMFIINYPITQSGLWSCQLLLSILQDMSSSYSENVALSVIYFVIIARSYTTTLKIKHTWKEEWMITKWLWFSFWKLENVHIWWTKGYLFQLSGF